MALLCRHVSRHSSLPKCLIGRTHKRPTKVRSGQSVPSLGQWDSLSHFDHAAHLQQWTGGADFFGVPEPAPGRSQLNSPAKRASCFPMQTRWKPRENCIGLANLAHQGELAPSRFPLFDSLVPFVTLAIPGYGASRALLKPCGVSQCRELSNRRSRPGAIYRAV